MGETHCQPRVAARRSGAAAAPRALSLVGVLGTRYHLTQRKIRNLLDQLMGLSFSVGAISQAHGKVACALKTPVAEAVESLRQGLLAICGTPRARVACLY
ncbi:MAG: hypothetical protein U1E95_06065 [Rubrivivax sp.]